MALSIIYRLDGPWGVGLGHNLTADDIDNNFWVIQQAIEALQSSRPQPDSIASFRVAGTALYETLQSGTEIGPVPMPFLRFDWKGPWIPSTVYNPTAVFTVDSQGIYFVDKPYTSGLTFDETVVDGDGNPILLKLFGYAQNSDNSYNTGFCYSGRIADQTIGYLYQEPFLVSVTIPATTGHLAYLMEPATADLSLPILSNDTKIGSIEFASSSHTGAFVWTGGDTSLTYGDRLAVGLPATPDATAAGLSVSFVGVRA